MECPRCHTPNPSSAVRCLQCDTPIDLDLQTLLGPEEEEKAPEDANLTLENWSAPVTAPSGSEPRSATDPLQTGNLLAGRYEILDRLGGGGMGTVYKARDREVDRLVAVKVIRADLANDSDILSRFKQELILARKVTHKNVIRIFDLGRASGMRFITMEYIEGQDLRSFIKKTGRPTPQAAVEIIQQVCNALEAAHSEGIVHRDLKPPNIMIDAQNRVYVMDFGIARSVGSEGLTMTGALIGTPDYMSPEQVRGEDIDCRSDIFSLGIIFYELLTGKMPYRGETVQKAMYKRTVERAKPVISEEPSIPAFLSDVVSKCLEIEREKRYQTVSEIAADLNTWKSGEADRASSVLERWLRHVAANRMARIAAVAILALGIGAYAVRRLVTPSPEKTASATKQAIALAVVPFRNASGDASLDWLGSSLGDMLSVGIGQSSTMRTIPEARVSQVYTDLRLTPGTNLDPSTLDRIAQFTNADLVVYGSYAKFGEQVRIDATLLDRKNARSIPLNAEAANEKDVLKTVDQLAKQIRDNLALSSSTVAELQATAFTPSSQSVPALRDYNKGLELQRAGKSLEAREAFSAATTEDPNFALAYSGLAQAFASLGQDDQAQANSLKAVNFSQSLPQPERNLINARNAKIMKDYPKAIAAYENMVKSSPGDTTYLFQLAGLYEDAGELDKARDTLAKLQSLDPKDGQVLLARGRVELKSNQPDKALEFLNTAQNLAIEVNNEELKANVLQAMGNGYYAMHRLDDALRSYQDSLALKRKLGLKKGAAASLGSIASLQVDLGKPDEALKNYNESLKLSREIGDTAGVANSLIDLGSFYVNRNQPEKGLPLFKESLQMLIELGDDATRSLVLSNIGNIYLGQGDSQEAHTFYEQALQLMEKSGATDTLPVTLHNLAETDAALGLYDQAIDRYHSALDLQRKADNKQGIALENSGLGTIYGMQGRYGAALSAKEEAVKLLRDINDQTVAMVDVLGGYGSALASVGRADDARKNLQDALQLARTLKDTDRIAIVLGYLGDNAFYAGDLANARQFYMQAAQAGGHSSDRGVVMTTKFNLARLAADQGRAAEAISALSSIGAEAGNSVPKFLATQAAIWLGRSYLAAKNPKKAQEVLQAAVLQAEKLGLQGLKAQGHALLAASLRAQGKSGEADTEAKVAAQIFNQIQSESHFDPRTRHDFTTGIS
jgi:eukaryotic-like serine/threonine-protein kinase